MPRDVESRDSALSRNANRVLVIFVVELWPLEAVNWTETTVSTGANVFFLKDIGFWDEIDIWRCYYPPILACDCSCVKGADSSCGCRSIHETKQKRQDIVPSSARVYGLKRVRAVAMNKTRANLQIKELT